MKVEIIGYKNDVDNSPTSLIITGPAHVYGAVWLEMEGIKVTVDTQDFLRALSVFLPKIDLDE